MRGGRLPFRLSTSIDCITRRCATSKPVTSASTNGFASSWMISFSTLPLSPVALEQRIALLLVRARRSFRTSRGSTTWSSGSSSGLRPRARSGLVPRDELVVVHEAVDAATITRGLHRLEHFLLQHLVIGVRERGNARPDARHRRHAVSGSGHSSIAMGPPRSRSTNRLRSASVRRRPSNAMLLMSRIPPTWSSGEWLTNTLNTGRRSSGGPFPRS